MAKKKKYVPKEKNGWDEDAAKKHVHVIKEKETALHEKYKKWWDKKKKAWKPGFNGHELEDKE